MTLDQVIADLGLAESADLLSRDWDDSESARPVGELPFLSSEFVLSACREAYVHDEIAEAAVRVARRVADSAALSALAWHFHCCLLATDYPKQMIARWPSLEGVLGDEAGLFHLVVLLSCLPSTQAIHEAHQVPDGITRDTLLDLKLWLEAHKGRHRRARWGLSPQNVSWLSNHFRGDLYRLGRLQYQFDDFGYPIRAFRHRGSGVVVAIAEEGVRFEANGGRDAEHTGDGAWTSRLAITDHEITGHPILPTGRALQREVRLAAAEWQQVLGPGQPVLYLHIAAGQPLAHDLCGDSFRAATAFFPRHFPERPFSAFCCGSWLLNAQIEEFLPATSNIVRFQREFYLFPIALDSAYLLSRVFGERPEDISKAPRSTSFQRALADYLLGGGKLQPSGGGCFLLPEDLDWGSQVYRKQQFPW